MAGTSAEGRFRCRWKACGSRCGRNGSHAGPHRRRNRPRPGPAPGRAPGWWSRWPVRAVPMPSRKSRSSAPSPLADGDLRPGCALGRAGTDPGIRIHPIHPGNRPNARPEEGPGRNPQRHRKVRRRRRRTWKAPRKRVLASVHPPAAPAARPGRRQRARRGRRPPKGCEAGYPRRPTIHAFTRNRTVRTPISSASMPMLSMERIRFLSATIFLTNSSAPPKEGSVGV